MHDHAHDHGAGIRKSNPLWGLFLLSVVYMVAEVVGGFLAGSLALLADAGHMAIDTLAIGLGLFAAWVAQKPPTHEKTYGYYRAEILAALLNGATLVAGSLWIVVEAVRRSSEPRIIQGPLMTGIAAGGLVINLIGLFLVHRSRRDNLNIRGVWLHLLTDTMGSLSAVAAGLFVWLLGWTLADPIISIFIACLILYGAWKLLSECVNVLLEGVPKGVRVAEIKQAIEAVDGVAEVHDLHVWMVTSGVNALSAHVRLKKDVAPARALEAMMLVVRDGHHIDHVTLQLEPSDFSADQCRLLHCTPR